MTSISKTIESHWRHAYVCVLVILGIALALRVWGVWFGLPHIFHNDEPNEVLRALQLGAGQFNFERIGKGGFFYLLFVEYGFLYLGLSMFDVVDSAADFGAYFMSDPTAFYLIGRTTAAVVGTFTVYLIYRIGRLGYSTGAGVFGAALLAVNILHANLSHFIAVDVPMVCLATASLYFAIKMVTSGTHRDYWWAALLAALAVSTKLSAILLVIPLFIAHCYFVGRTGGGPRQYFFSKTLWQAVLIFVGVYTLATPGIVFYIDEVILAQLGNFIGTDNPSADALVNGLDGRSMLANTNLFVYYMHAIVESMTWPVFAVCIGGVAYAVWKTTPPDVVLVSFAVAMYVVLSSSTDAHLFFPRYILPVLPIMVLLGGRLLSDSIDEVLKRRTLAATAVITVLAATPVSAIIADDYLMTQKDTRALAKDWIDANIEANARIMIEGSRNFVYESTVPLKNSTENLRTAMDYYRGNEPGYVRFLEMALRSRDTKRYDLVTVQRDGLRDLHYYKDSGVEYLVLRPEEYPGSRLQYTWPELVADVRSDPDISLIQKFVPDPESRPGPVIEIYRVDVNVDTAGDHDAK